MGDLEINMIKWILQLFSRKTNNYWPPVVNLCIKDKWDEVEEDLDRLIKDGADIYDTGDNIFPNPKQAVRAKDFYAFIRSMGVFTPPSYCTMCPSDYAINIVWANGRKTHVEFEIQEDGTICSFFFRLYVELDVPVTSLSELGKSFESIHMSETRDETDQQVKVEDSQTGIQPTNGLSDEKVSPT